MKDDFKKELTSLLNRHGWDNACEIPDHILADYVENCLKNLCGTISKDIDWHKDWKRLGTGKEEETMMSPREHLEESLNYALETAKLNNEKDFSSKLNETEQGIFEWGLDFLKIQRKNLEAMNKDFSVTNKHELEHIFTQILLLDKFVKLIKDKTVLIPWEKECQIKK